VLTNKKKELFSATIQIKLNLVSLQEAVVLKLVKRLAVCSKKAYEVRIKFFDFSPVMDHLIANLVHGIVCTDVIHITCNSERRVEASLDTANKGVKRTDNNTNGGKTIRRT
jgi:hypothetical protein